LKKFFLRKSEIKAPQVKTQVVEPKNLEIINPEQVNFDKLESITPFIPQEKVSISKILQ